MKPSSLMWGLLAAAGILELGLVNNFYNLLLTDQGNNEPVGSLVLNLHGGLLDFFDIAIIVCVVAGMAVAFALRNLTALVVATVGTALFGAMFEYGTTALQVHAWAWVVGLGAALIVLASIADKIGIYRALGLPSRPAGSTG